MKKASLIAAVFVFAVAALAHAQNDGAVYEVTADDLTTAGMTDVVPIEPEEGRFLPPVAYFRVARTDEPEAKDCDDCHDIAAVHVGEVPAAPSWAGEDALRRIGSRFQKRRYVPQDKLVIIVTAPDPNTAVALTDHLTAKFSR